MATAILFLLSPLCIPRRPGAGGGGESKKGDGISLFDFEIFRIRPNRKLCPDICY